MNLRVTEDCTLVGVDTPCELTWIQFNFLTGLNINFLDRIGKEIILTRNKGHLYVSDAEFIQGCKYKSPAGDNYICVYVKPDHVLLSGNRMNIATAQNDASNFRIIK